MRIIRDRAVVDDHWQHVRDAPDDTSSSMPPGDIIVPLAWWLDKRRELITRGTGIGVCLAPADDVHALDGELDRIGLVALTFDVFTEGRGYSQARLLRDKLGFTGEIRAVGDVSRDRIAFMARCGINAFELRDGERPEDALSAFSEIQLHYQPATDTFPTVARLRGFRTF